MKVLLFSLNWVEYLIQMANALTAEGHQVEVIFKSARVRQTVGDALPDLLDRRVRYYTVDDRPRGLRDPRQYATAVRLIQLFRSIKPDVINMHEATNTFLPPCFKLGAAGVPLLLTIHDITTHPGQDSSGPSRWEHVRWYFRRRADAIIVHGEWLRERYLEQAGDYCRNVHVVPHGCYTVFRHWAQPTPPSGDRTVLFYGRIHEYKGLSQLLDAAELVAPEIPDLKVVIAGTGADVPRYRDRILAQPDRFLLHDQHMSDAEVARFVQQSSVVVLPYIEGSQSGVVRVAYALGRPVIVTNVGSLAEGVREGETGFVIPPRDTRALADAMIRMLKDRNTLTRMADNARTLADNEMSWEIVARRTIPVLESLVQRAKPSDRADAAPRDVATPSGPTSHR